MPLSARMQQINQLASVLQIEDVYNHIQLINIYIVESINLDVIKRLDVNGLMIDAFVREKYYQSNSQIALKFLLIDVKMINCRCSDLVLTSCSGTKAKSTCYVNLCNVVLLPSFRNYLIQIVVFILLLVKNEMMIYGMIIIVLIKGVNISIKTNVLVFANGHTPNVYSKNATIMTYTGIMNNKQCYWDGSYCQALTSCKEYITYSKLIDTSSLTFHGFKLEGEVCVLLPDFNLQLCCLFRNYRLLYLFKYEWILLLQ
ncbi:unnamed protein product [Paramecium octaurelia]|uniref:Uncharacterized protein n=1 Tax=Paramecium octaurelia TaxID=43137 RepID=A0A8S1X369_PAROT|nr:unnamed protein product [Paramecium octaurelia]